MKSIEFATTLLNKYLDDIPRFKVREQNQSEFLYHISIASFNAGARYVLDHLDEEARNALRERLPELF